MTKLRKTVLMLGALLATSVAFVGCSDDDGKLPDDMLGASFIQAITAGTTSVDLRWTITPTDNVDGYKVQIFSGTRDNMGAEVASGTFDKKTPTGTFTGLQPNTKYVAVTQCIPAAGSKFKTADVAYYEFWTAPVMTLTSVNTTVTQMVDEETGKLITKIVDVLDEDGQPVMKPIIDPETGEPVVGVDGEPIMEPETEEIPVYQATITVNWQESLTIQNVNGIYVYLEDSNGDQVAYFLTEMTSQNLGTSYTFIQEEINPGEQYAISVIPNPSEYSFYTTSTAEWSNDLYFTMSQPVN